MPFHLSTRRAARIAALAGAVLLAASVTSCAGSTTSSSTTNTGSAAGRCGMAPTIAPNDPKNLLASLDAKTAADYNGFSTKIQASSWAHWKPTHAGPYTVAIVSAPLSNPFQSTMIGSMRDELKAEGIQIISDQAVSGYTDVPQQLQLLGQAISLKPDLILLNALAAGPMVDSVNQAGAAGIPVIGVNTAIDSPYAINVSQNSVNQAAITAADVFKIVGGKGTALQVQGIPGAQAETDGETGFKAALAECPDITVAGQVTGAFQNSVAQTAVLQYLATNPAGVDMVLQTGTMGLGVLQAFQQSGRAMVPMTDIGASRGTIATAHQNPTPPYVGTGTPDAALGKTMAEVAARVLAGQGPKINQITKTPVIITSDNLADVYVAGWDTSDATDASTKDDNFLAGDALNTFFNSPTLTLK